MTDIISTQQPNPTQTGVPQQPVGPVVSEPVQSPPEQQPPSVSRNALLILIGIAAVLGVILFGINKIALSPRVQPNSLGQLLVTVGNEKIYTSTVESAAREQYAESAITKDVLKRFEEILIERAILDQEAKTLGITVTSEEVTKALSSQYGNNQKVTQSASVRDVTYYQILKTDITDKSVKNISAYTMGFYIAPFDYPQKPEYAQERTDGVPALNEIQQRLTNNEEPINIAKVIVQKYPSLKDILSINGHIYSVVTDLSLLHTPVTVVLTKSLLTKNLMSPDLYNAFSVIKANEIQKIEAKDGSGGKVIKAVSVNSSGYLDYQSFIDARKKQLVIVTSTL